MLIRTLLVTGTLCFSAHAQNAVSVDYTNDCDVDDFDAGEFIRAFGRGEMEAELTGDGLVDVYDIMAFVKAIPKDPGDFTVHWCVSNQYGTKPLGFSHRMDGADGEDPLHPDVDTSELPVVKDVCIFYDRDCGDYPIGGIHEMLLRYGDPDRWSESFEDWRASHRAILMENVPRLLTSRTPHYTHAVLDMEEPNPRWLDMRSHQAWGDPEVDRRCREWEALVDAVNTPTWDLAFFAETGYMPPLGTTGITDLSVEEREPAYQLTHDRFVRRLFMLTLGFARQAAEPYGDVKWSFWKYPRTPPDWTVDEEWRARNDDLAWMYRAVDVLAPNFYRMRYTSWDPNDPNSCDSARTRSPEKQAITWVSCMLECIRLKEQYNPTAEIIPFLWWHYGVKAGDCHMEVVNALDVAESVRIPRRWGADGVYLWGYVNPSDMDYYTAEPLPREEVQQMLQAKWEQALWDAVCH